MSIKHRIEASNSTLHRSFNNSYRPITTICSGDSVQYSTIDVEMGYNEKDGRRREFSSREQEDFWGHPLIGPVFIEGAKAGMTLEVKINQIVPSWYGWNCAAGKTNWHNEQLGISEKEQVRLEWLIDYETGVATCERNGRSFSVPVRPFMGVMANAPGESGTYSTIPPRYCGGNLDCKELVKGSTLYLPIAVDGALFSVGDGHAAQGDGEVSGQAIECPMDLVDLTFTVREDMRLRMPRANTPSGWVTFGLDEDLNKATVAALEEMLSLIQEVHGVSKEEATALASVAVDLRITQIVNQIKGVHAVLPHGFLR
ncbi:acetamidase/formamidase family protein [Anaerobacillus sp. MEB173]|uniref:acetamidase/formamidase family protein n=1 Tax=Anaerobacillus sp. MEB173 TaxID=3383345 RepID=UPI003F92D684